MPAKRLPWIKFYPELLEHEKFADLSDSESWTWINVWAKASQQPVRWRFASAAHAAKVTGRSASQIRKLIAARLLDEHSDGLWVHDWQQWQNRYPSDYEHSDDGPPTDSEDSPQDQPNAPRTLHEDSAKTPRTLPQAPSRGHERAKIEIEIEKGDIERDVEIDVTPDAIASDPNGRAQDFISGMEHHTWLADATGLHNEVQAYMEKHGYMCTREYPVADRGDGRPGRVDLVAEQGDLKLAIEIDAANPRAKSSVKLIQVENAVRIVLLRGDRRAMAIPDGVDLVGFLPHPKGRQRVVTVDEQFKAELTERFWESFGSREAVADCMAAALSYKNAAKYVDQRAYLRNWVRSDAERAARRRGGQNGIALLAPPEPECTCDEVRAKLAINRNSYPLCDVHGRVEL